MHNIAAIILAAGEGTRMRSLVPKVLHTICGQPMINYPLSTIKSIGIKKTIVVIGHKAGAVKESLKGIKCIKQDRLLGTGDAVLKTKSALLKANKVDTVLITYGDIPLLKAETLRRLITRHISTHSGCTLLTSNLKNPTGYGRILRAGNNRITKIVEEMDASIYEKVIEEINVGVYCFDKDALFDALEKIKPNNRKKEYYLTDTIEILSKSDIAVDSVSTDEVEEFLGVNTRSDLMQAEDVVRRRVLSGVMQKGVTIVDPNNTYIQGDVEIKSDTIIYPYTFIDRGVKIGPQCSIGPFARLRQGTVLDEGVSIGNFVEIVRSKIGKFTKVRHQCYIGDTVIGKRVNIGAGTIVANYDGKRKHKTIIEDNAFIGTGTILIAPVKVGRAAVTGSGSVVTKNHNVPVGKTVVGVPAKVLRKK